MRSTFAATALCLLLAGCSQTQLGDGSLATGSTIPPAEGTKVATLPNCPQPLGSIVIEDRQNPTLAELGLPSPTPVLQNFVAESKCFQIVDPAAAAIAAGRGKRKSPSPDYVLGAEIVSQNPNAGGGSVNLGSILPGRAGQVLQSVSVNTSIVKTTLTLADTRSGLQVAIIPGQAQSTDVGATIGGLTRRADISIGAYAETPIGRTASAALLDAYVKLVKHMQAQPARPVASAKR
jgi:hypothetical protein